MLQQLLPEAGVGWVGDGELWAPPLCPIGNPGVLGMSEGTAPDTGL